MSERQFAVAIHGGAGVMPGRNYDRAKAHLESLIAECRTRLEGGASAIDLVEFAVTELEDSGLYVAGRGSGPNTAGYVELDASIMDGARRKAGAVSAVRDLVNPVRAARLVMEHTHHIMLAGRGAEGFCRGRELAFVEDPESYYRIPDGVDPAEMSATELRHGTVGAVAMDQDGALAAATSTGGLFGKLEGRIGDTPLIGSGTWADRKVAVSCTGIGEAFILAGGAQDIASRVRYLGEPLDEAVDALIRDVAGAGGDGGVVAVGANGEITMRFNSPGMKRAWASNSEPPKVAIF